MISVRDFPKNFEAVEAAAAIVSLGFSSIKAISFNVVAPPSAALL